MRREPKLSQQEISLTVRYELRINQNYDLMNVCGKDEGTGL